MKKFLVFLLVTAIFGTAWGFAVSGVKHKPLVRNGQEEEAARLMEETRRAANIRAGKNVEGPTELAIGRCDSPVHNFGLMDPLTVGEHTFTIRNTGTASLVLTGGESSCKCTLSDLKETIVQPGAEHAVTLTWNSGHANREFGQTATIRTNDPISREIVLSVTGEVRAVIAALPSTLDLQRLLPSTKASKQFVVYSQIWDEFTIERVESTNSNVSAHVDTEPFQGSFSIDDEINHASSVRVIRVNYDGEAPQGPLSGLLRIYVRPPEEWVQTQREGQARTRAIADAPDRAPLLSGSSHGLESSGLESSGDHSASEPSSDGALPDLSFPTQPDGSVLAEIGFHGQVVRRLSLYGKVVRNAGLIELGKVRSKNAKDTSWMIIARIRGSQKVDGLSAEVFGIPGVTAEVKDISNKDGREQSFRIKLQLNQQLSPAIYDRQQAGKLIIQAPGIVGEEELELPVHLDVLGDR